MLTVLGRFRSDTSYSVHLVLYFDFTPFSIRYIALREGTAPKTLNFNLK